MTPTNAQDVVAVLDSTFAQVFSNARAMKATISRDSKVMAHPIEDGASVVDHRVILPVSVELSMVLASQDYPAVYQSIRALFFRAELLTVQTRVDSFGDMLIEKMPHEETADIMDGVALVLRLQEAKLVTPAFAPLKVARPADSSTTKRGQQQGAEADAATTERSQSVLAGVFS